jgi:hypothetical protein
VYLKSDPSRSYPFSAFPESGDHDKDIAATFTGKPPTASWNQGFGKILDTMNASFCEVAVDTETGKVEVTKYVVACDPGKVLRVTSFEGQIHQVMFFSDGCGLTEEFVFDKATGVKLNTNMFEYKKPTILDIGPCETILVETQSGNAAYGSTGSAMPGDAIDRLCRGECDREVAVSAAYAGQDSESVRKSLACQHFSFSTCRNRHAIGYPPSSLSLDGDCDTDTDCSG